jgi:dienelactone hydrolase
VDAVRRGRRSRALPLGTLLALAACGAPEPGVVRLDFRRSTSFWDAPFPSASLVDDAGRVTLGAFPNPGRVALVDQGVALLEGATGFGLASGVFFRLEVPLDPSSLPSVLDSRDPSRSSVVLLDLESRRAHPAAVHYAPDGGPFATTQWLAVLPANGVPLLPARRYAVLVTTRVRETSGAPLVPSPVVEALAEGAAVDGLSESARAAHQAALDVALEVGLGPEQLAGLTTFTTHDPTAGLAAQVALARARPPPEVSALTLSSTHAEFCVFEGTTTLPDYQAGAPPYAEVGGQWSSEARAAPSRVVLTVPRLAAGAPLPLVVFVRTGGGGDRPLVDRGVRDAVGRVLTPASGPARELAQAGVAGLSIDGPHGGPRNPSGADEQFLMFNFLNPGALRDNVRQSALELALLPALIAGLEVDATGCVPSGGRLRFDTARLGLMGHSMGATIAPLAAWAAPEYRALVLSGAGASWLENLLHKQKPLPVRPLAEALLGYTERGVTLAAHDPVLSLVQWAIEPADPLVYAPALSAPHVLMLQGIVDHYIMPPIAEALSTALTLEQGGPSLDVLTPELAAFPGLAEARRLSGAAAPPYPIAPASGQPTRVVVQHAADGVEDGHEVMFQTDGAKTQYRCFWRTFAAGAPVVIAPDAACP